MFVFEWQINVEKKMKNFIKKCLQKQLWNLIKAGKAAGPSGVPSELLKVQKR